MRLTILLTRRLKAPRGKVFRIVTEFDKLQERFPSLFSSIRVLERSPQGALTEESFVFLGVTFEQRSRHHMVNGKTHTVEILTGDLAGSTIVEHYADGPDGETTVKLEARVALRGLASLLPPPIVKPLVEANLQRVLDEVEKYLEKHPTAGSSARAGSRSG